MPPWAAEVVGLRAGPETLQETGDRNGVEALHNLVVTTRLTNTSQGTQ